MSTTLHSLFPDLGNPQDPDGVTEVFIYVDEIKKFKNPLGEYWMYIGLLLVRSEDKRELLEHLLQCRDEVCYHDELHFRGLTNYSYARVYSEKTKLAVSWIEEVLSENKPRKVYFHILGLNLSRLEHRAFGRRRRTRNIYNRFFRALALYCLKSYFGGRGKISVRCVFHDECNLRTDDLFDWHTIWRIEKEEESVSFDEKTILFIDSDHKKEKLFPEESHFIQLIDVILGAATQCLDAGKKKDGCNEVALTLMPLVERLNNDQRIGNPNSRYDHCRKCGLSFFPRRTLTLRKLEDPWERLQSGFYRNRRLLLKDRLSGQQTLF